MPEENTQENYEEVPDAKESGEAAPEGGESATPSEGEEIQEKHKPSRVEKRIKQLVWEREEEKRKSKGLEERLAKLEESKSTKLKEDDFNSFEEYEEARRKQDTEITRKVIREELLALRQLDEKTTAEQKAKQEFLSKVDNARKVHKDFDSVAVKEGYDNDTADLVEASENTGELMYYFGKYPEKLDAINNFSSLSQKALAIAKIETELINTKTKNLPNTPPPMEEALGGGIGDTQVSEEDKTPEQLQREQYPQGNPLSFRGRTT